ncbi:hypothetical protein GCM10010185_60680 [Saccharothrix coeruleofusca]|uniref:Branched-subunit amino acid transport protein AzlD n=1 Tax=Saccharothrix coeruleofusca TaxID=33919 RepID=A0A918EHR5_9PSEU|nr:hypothetical protein GCM10010185_60680 [Saccharothrix coeruleofusca]
MWWVVAALALTSVALRVVLPLVLGGRELPGWLGAALLNAGPALLAGLVVMLLWPSGPQVSAFRTLTALAGVSVGVVLLAAKRSILTAMAGAALVSALLRLLLS